MITVQGIDTTGFNREMTKWADALGVRSSGFGSGGDGGRSFVKKQVQLLLKLLVQITPPKDRKKTRENVEHRVKQKFRIIGKDYQGEMHGHKTPRGKDVEWYTWDTLYLYGVAKKANKRGASADEVYKLFKSITPKGRILSDFKHPRKRQRVLIWQKTTISKRSQSALIKRLWGHIGRLKAGWLVAWDKLQTPYPVLDWVGKHRKGARGRIIDELGTPNKPSVTITNYAIGAGKMKSLVNFAMKARMKAMVKDAQLYLSKIKRQKR